MLHLNNYFEEHLSSWVNLIQSNKYIILTAFFITTGFCFIYTVNNIGINTDTKDMLSEDLPWRKLDAEYDKYFPQNSDNLLIVIEGNTPDVVIDAARLINNRLSLETDLFNYVFNFRSTPFIQQASLLFLNHDELQDLADNLAAMQPFLSRLIQDKSIPGLFDMLQAAIDARDEGDEVDLDPLLIEINKTLTAQDRDKIYKVSWQNLITGEEQDKEIYREFILTQPILDHDEFLHASDVITRVREITSELIMDNQFNIKVRLTGSVALSYEEFLSVSKGTLWTIVGALIIVTIIMLLGLGSYQMVVFTLITLITGLILTAAFATYAVGELNLISVAFAVLYIGLGVDFAIHFCMRYRELLLSGSYESGEALDDTVKYIGVSLFICALTTAIAFFSFLPTEYDGIAELGLISGFGIFISFLVTMTVLPALLSIFPSSKNQNNSMQIFSDNTFMKFLVSIPVDHAKKIKMLVLFTILSGFFLLPLIKFDINTLNLQSNKNESVQTYLDLLSDSDTTPWSSIILADNKEIAIKNIEKIKNLPLVDHIVWLGDLVPEDQDEKLFIIDEMNLILGDITRNEINTIHTIETDYTVYTETLNKFADSINEDDTSLQLVRLKNNLEGFLEKIFSANKNEQISKLKSFEKSLLDFFPGRFETLKTALTAEQISENTIPESIRSNWKSPHGKYLIEIHPVENLGNNEAMKRFVRELQSEYPEVIGSPVIMVEAGEAVVRAFQQAFISALIVITLILIILMKNIRDTITTILPILLAAIMTALFCVIFDIQINFANIIALPLLLGIGIDSAIHIMHRHKTVPPDNGFLLTTSSSKAVMVSAFTTITSIGNLAFSPHVGTASMGLLLSIGITMTLICSLIVLPSFLNGK